MVTIGINPHIQDLYFSRFLGASTRNPAQVRANIPDSHADSAHGLLRTAGAFRNAILVPRLWRRHPASCPDSCRQPAKLVTGSRTRASLRSLEIRHMPRAAAACPAIIDNAYVQSAEREKVELVLRLTAIAVTGELSCIACRAFATRCSACSAELYAVLLSLNAPLFQLYARKVVHVQYSLPAMYTC